VNGIQNASRSFGTAVLTDDFCVAWAMDASLLSGVRRIIRFRR